MKARHKETGRIMDVKYAFTKNANGTLVDYFSEINDNSSDDQLYYPETDFDFDDTADWEQRRYEITRDVTVGLFCNNEFLGDYILAGDDSLQSKCASTAEIGVMLADEIIKVLKRKSNESK